MFHVAIVTVMAAEGEGGESLYREKVGDGWLGWVPQREIRQLSLTLENI